MPVESAKDMVETKEWKIWSSGMMRYIDSEGNQTWKETLEYDPSKEKIWSSGMKVMKNASGEILWVKIDEVTDDMVSIVKGTATVKDHQGNMYRVPVDDPRIKSGELVGVNRGKAGLANHLNEKKFTCEHCGKQTTLGNIRRWHGENCKLAKR